MKIMAMGDYYVWFCDWCDSRNHTLWTRVETASPVCTACQRSCRHELGTMAGHRHHMPPQVGAGLPFTVR